MVKGGSASPRAMAVKNGPGGFWGKIKATRDGAAVPPNNAGLARLRIQKCDRRKCRHRSCAKFFDYFGAGCVITKPEQIREVVWRFAPVELHTKTKSRWRIQHIWRNDLPSS